MLTSLLPSHAAAPSPAPAADTLSPTPTPLPPVPVVDPGADAAVLHAQDRALVDAQRALEAALKEHRGMTPPMWQFMARLPVETATLDEIEDSVLLEDDGVFTCLTSKTAYLAWVAQYKALMIASRDMARALKRLRQTPPELDLQSRAQEDLWRLRRLVTTAIRLRRLGKRWSAARARQGA